VLHFYNVSGRLVRRWVPAQRRLALEVWNGDGWAVYPSEDSLLRQGQRLTDEQALGLLHETRDRAGTFTSFSEAEAGVALRARQRRA
jgi:hypothetical protein